MFVTYSTVLFFLLKSKALTPQLTITSKKKNLSATYF